MKKTTLVGILGLSIILIILASLISADSELPSVTKVEYNKMQNKTLKSVSDIEPSGIGVRNISIFFNKNISFEEKDIIIEKVNFTEGIEYRTRIYPGLIAYSSYTKEMIIQFETSEIMNTWVKVTLKENITDDEGNMLDGDAFGSGKNYIFNQSDLPTGDGTEGGDAVFYVGSLKGDMRGVGFTGFKPDGKINVWDINGFTSAYSTAINNNISLSSLP